MVIVHEREGVGQGGEGGRSRAFGGQGLRRYCRIGVLVPYEKCAYSTFLVGPSAVQYKAVGGT